MTELDEYWEKFIKETGRDPEDRCSGDIDFEAKGLVGAERISLILSGRKTAFFSSFATYTIDQEPLPVSGELYLVLDKNSKPCCVIELDNVSIIPFNEVPWELALQEGEDENLAAWKEKQQEYLEDEGQILGFEFSPDIKLVFQKFHVVYK
ncbi:MAG: ASCH domain-containing protein [Treponema sp.]|nr:ASCH domain-containing protein [Treponema sp.]